MSVNHTHICTACNQAQERGDGFCDDCGTQLVAIRYCDDCGVMAPHAGKFCRECGAKLPPPPAVSAQPSQSTTTVAPPKPIKPAWLSEPAPAPAPKAKPVSIQKPKPVSTPRPIAKTAKKVDVAPVDNTPAPLAPRPMAAPVAMRSAPLAPASSTANTTTAIMATTAGVLAVGALMLNSIPLAFGLFIMMLILGGIRLRHTAANGVDSIIDWVWEDPVLRKRFLGE